jgi:tetratricopeptide (TPR) repeat protein
VPEAIACWERACRADPSFPTPYRNLALAYFNKRGKKAAALRALSQAFQAEPTDARVLLELDLLKKRLGVLPKKRLEFLLKHRDLVEQREDLLLELATLFNFFGKHQDALELLLARNFHPWEGGEGKVTGQYVVSLTEMAKQALGPACDLGLARFRRKTPVRSPATPAHNHAGTERAIELLQRARIYPRNLGEGKLDGAQENQIFYWLGVAHECLGDTAVAHQHWNQAAAGMTEPTPALYYNDQNPESIFYQGLALLKLRKGRAAKVRFESLLKFGQLHLKDKVVIDYFAVSLPEFLVFDDDLDQRNQINCRYLMALGYFGLGKLASAQTQLNQVLGLDPSHLPARLHLNLLTS